MKTPLYPRLAIAALGLLLLPLLPVQPSAWAAAWKPAEGPLKTRWAKDVSPENAHPEYPRPQLVRKEWLNLNGLWDFAITPKTAQPEAFTNQILVPFPVESALSGVMKPVTENDRLWYRRTFEVPRKWQGRRLLLHFGAVDFEATVLVNGKEVGQHRGGYDGFVLDITSAVNLAAPNELVVSVWDPTDAGTQPRGKQVRKPHGIWYTPTSGIWQTVWLEPVQAAYFKELRITPDVDNSTVVVEPVLPTLLNGFQVEVSVREGFNVFSRATVASGTKEIKLPLKNPKLWSPERPYLYTVVARLKLGNRTVDEVQSYVGMRKISLGKDENGFTRLMLNNKPYFQFGPLDQGFWPDGLYTAPTDEALRFDIEMTKKLGYNMARKHVKVEPDRWYYWCDKLGLLVWQDMPSGDAYIHGNMPDITRTPESGAQFERELQALIAGLRNHPCIVMWVPYNEGWGQWDTPRIVEMLKKLDPSRLVDDASGWTDRGVGDVMDMHQYPGPGCPKPEAQRASVLGEFGGLGLPLRGHTWQSEKNWGYRSYTNSEALTSAYLDLVQKLFPLIGSQGLSAAVYTQTTDVEVEVNGVMTYDRELVKMDWKKIAAANRGQFVPQPGKFQDVPVVTK